MLKKREGCPGDISFCRTGSLAAEPASPPLSSSLLWEQFILALGAGLS